MSGNRLYDSDPSIVIVGSRDPEEKDTLYVMRGTIRGGKTFVPCDICHREIDTDPRPRLAIVDREENFCRVVLHFCSDECLESYQDRITKDPHYATLRYAAVMDDAVWTVYTQARQGADSTVEEPLQ